MTAVLRCEGISKSYGGVRALQDIDFEVEAGAVTALIGENGAGKSTLMKILAGAERPDAGRLLLDGQPVAFISVRDAAAAGVGIVFQELNLCPNLTVRENIFLTDASRMLIDRASEQARAAGLLARLEHDIDLDAPVGGLKIGQQQIVEIAKALAGDARVLILDEPTSSLSTVEVEILFKVIRELTGAGVAVIYISHRLDELMRIGDRVTVLRDGRLQASAAVRDIDVSWIVAQMLGDRAVGASGPRKAAEGEVILDARDLSLDRSDQGAPLHGVSVQCRAGEIVALYGLLGSGRSELLEALAGARSLKAGSVRLKGADLSRLSIADRLKRGVAFVPEDRQRDGLFANLDVGSNLSLSRLTEVSRAGLLNVGRLGEEIRGMLARLGVKAASPAEPIHSLSGGNQQKVLIGRNLMAGPSVLLLDEPGRGVDVGARADIFATIQALAEQGMAVLFATSDMEEARLHADRVIVLAGGQLTADLAPGEATDLALVQASNRIANNDNVARRRAS